MRVPFEGSTVACLVASMLPRARYLLKLAEEKCDVSAVASYVVGCLQQRGLQCVSEKGHIVISADPELIKAQVRQSKGGRALRVYLCHSIHDWCTESCVT